MTLVLFGIQKLDLKAAQYRRSPVRGQERVSDVMYVIPSRHRSSSSLYKFGIIPSFLVESRIDNTSYHKDCHVSLQELRTYVSHTSCRSSVFDKSQFRILTFRQKIINYRHRATTIHYIANIAARDRRTFVVIKSTASLKSVAQPELFLSFLIFFTEYRSVLEIFYVCKWCNFLGYYIFLTIRYFTIKREIFTLYESKKCNSQVSEKYTKYLNFTKDFSPKENV